MVQVKCNGSLKVGRMLSTWINKSRKKVTLGINLTRRLGYGFKELGVKKKSDKKKYASRKREPHEKNYTNVRGTYIKE